MNESTVNDYREAQVDNPFFIEIVKQLSDPLVGPLMYPADPFMPSEHLMYRGNAIPRYLPGRYVHGLVCQLCSKSWSLASAHMRKVVARNHCATTKHNSWSLSEGFRVVINELTINHERPGYIRSFDGTMYPDVFSSTGQGAAKCPMCASENTAYQFSVDPAYLNNPNVFMSLEFDNRCKHSFLLLQSARSL